MKMIWAVLTENGGAHISCNVLSVWSTKDLADEEAAMINKTAVRGYEAEVREWCLDKSGEDDLSW